MENNGATGLYLGSRLAHVVKNVMKFGYSSVIPTVAAEVAVVSFGESNFPMVSDASPLEQVEIQKEMAAAVVPSVIEVYQSWKEDS